MVVSTVSGRGPSVVADGAAQGRRRAWVRLLHQLRVPQGCRPDAPPGRRAAVPVARPAAPGARGGDGRARLGRGEPGLLRLASAWLPARGVGLAAVPGGGLASRARRPLRRRRGDASVRTGRCRCRPSGAASACCPRSSSSGRAARDGCTTGWSIAGRACPDGVRRDWRPEWFGERSCAPPSLPGAPARRGTRDRLRRRSRRTSPTGSWCGPTSSTVPPAPRPTRRTGCTTPVGTAGATTSCSATPIARERLDGRCRSPGDPGDPRGRVCGRLRHQLHLSPDHDEHEVRHHLWADRGARQAADRWRDVAGVLDARRRLPGRRLAEVGGDRRDGARRQRAGSRSPAPCTARPTTTATGTSPATPGCRT